MPVFFLCGCHTVPITLSARTLEPGSVFNALYLGYYKDGIIYGFGDKPYDLPMMSYGKRWGLWDGVEAGAAVSFPLLIADADMKFRLFQNESMAGAFDVNVSLTKGFAAGGILMFTYDPPELILHLTLTCGASTFNKFESGEPSLYMGIPDFVSFMEYGVAIGFS